MGKPLRRNTKKKWYLFLNVSFGFSSSWNFFHRYHPAIWIVVIIHVEKTFKVMTGEMCGKDFDKKQKITKNFKKKQHECFWILSQRYKNF